MVIAEKAGGTISPLWGRVFRSASFIALCFKHTAPSRHFTSGAVVFTLYGSCVLLIVLMATCVSP
jgi:hypothetical protein